jgi:GntR family transcriptional regulator
MNLKSKRPPAHLVIRAHLLDLVNTLPPNARIPTEVALAGQFGVSRLTVHKMVVRLQQEGVVFSVPQPAEVSQGVVEYAEAVAK